MGKGGGNTNCRAQAGMDAGAAAGVVAAALPSAMRAKAPNPLSTLRPSEAALQLLASLEAASRWSEWKLPLYESRIFFSSDLLDAAWPDCAYSQLQVSKLLEALDAADLDQATADAARELKRTLTQQANDYCFEHGVIPAVAESGWRGKGEANFRRALDRMRLHRATTALRQLAPQWPVYQQSLERMAVQGDMMREAVAASECPPAALATLEATAATLGSPVSAALNRQLCEQTLPAARQQLVSTLGPDMDPGLPLTVAFARETQPDGMSWMRELVPGGASGVHQRMFKAVFLDQSSARDITAGQVPAVLTHELIHVSVKDAGWPVEEVMEGGVEGLTARVHNYEPGVSHPYREWVWSAESVAQHIRPDNPVEALKRMAASDTQWLGQQLWGNSQHPPADPKAALRELWARLERIPGERGRATTVARAALRSSS